MATTKTSSKTRTQARATSETTQAAATEAERTLRSLVRDSAYATIGVGDTAVRYVRGLGAIAATVRTDVPSTVRTVTDPRQLTKGVLTLRDSAFEEFDALAERGRRVVGGVADTRSVRRAADQSRVARSQVKAAGTSVRRAAEAGADVVEEAAEQVGEPTAVDYDALTVDELRDLARERDVEGRSEMKKDELIKALKKA